MHGKKCSIIIALLVLGLVWLLLGGQSRSCVDHDGDGFFVGTCGSGESECGPVDCDDEDSGIHPGMAENCENGIDDDCDLLVDLQDPDCTCWDNDGDDYTDEACGGSDCLDSDATVNPGRIESNANGNCRDGLDNDCNGFADDADERCFTSETVHIPGGCFDMGDSFSEGTSDELPAHNICLSAFEMDVHEVTCGEYAKCVDDGGCAPPPYGSSATRESYYGNPDYHDFPVIYIDWYAASGFCAWAGKRLPTEAEWEYAARGGLSGKRYPWGDTISQADANYWDDDAPEDNDTDAVQRYPSNGYGLYDMGGNVWEWVNDWHEPWYYLFSPQGDPQGPVAGLYRAFRGGSWGQPPEHLRIAARERLGPLIRLSMVGFRCAR